jgi:hypothetical protein
MAAMMDVVFSVDDQHKMERQKQLDISAQSGEVQWRVSATAPSSSLG